MIIREKIFFILHKTYDVTPYLNCLTYIVAPHLNHLDEPSQQDSSDEGSQHYGFNDK